MVDLCLNQNYLMYFENKIYNFSIYLNKHIHLEQVWQIWNWQRQLYNIMYFFIYF